LGHLPALQEIGSGTRTETSHVLVWDDATYNLPRPRRRSSTVEQPHRFEAYEGYQIGKREAT
jgi:hypothetical protein